MPSSLLRGALQHTLPSYSRFCPRVPSKAVSAERAPKERRNEIVVQTEDDSVRSHEVAIRAT